MNICLCGTEAGYPHEPTCPYPLYRPTAAQEDDWLRARHALRERLLAELQKRPEDVVDYIWRRANILSDGSEPA